MAYKGRLGHKTLVRIHLLDNSTKTLVITGTTTVEDVTKTMASKLSLRETQRVRGFFGLFSAHKGIPDKYPLAKNSKLLPVVTKWRETKDWYLVYQCHLLMKGETVIHSTDPRMQHMLFSQMVHHVITGIYPSNELDVIRLAALQLQERFGDHQKSCHVPGLLHERIHEFVPQFLLDKSKKPVEVWEKQILSEHKRLAARNLKPHAEYMSFVKHWAFAYHTLFVVKRKGAKSRKKDGHPKMLILGVHCDGISLFAPQSMAELQRWAMHDVESWGFDSAKSLFYFKPGPGCSGTAPGYSRGRAAIAAATACVVLAFKTQYAESISKLLTDYTQALLREQRIAREKASVSAMKLKRRVILGICKLQAAFRGYRLRRDMDQEYASIQIQAAFRGFRERSKLDALIEEMERALTTAAVAGPAESPRLTF